MGKISREPLRGSTVWRGGTDAGYNNDRLPLTMGAPQSYQLVSVHSDVDADKQPSPSTASIDPSQVRWLENQRSQGWEVCRIMFRALGTMSCAITVAICFAWYSCYPNVSLNIWPGISLIAAMPSFLWDLGEFLTICARHGRGFTPKALIGVELVLTLLSGIVTIWVSVQLSWLDLNAALDPANLVFGEYVCMGVNTLVRFCMFICACIERRREIRRRRPRVMYIPETGQTVYVVAKPFPKLPTWESQQAARSRSPLSSELPSKFSRLRIEVPELPPQFFQAEVLPDRSSVPSPIERKPVRRVPPDIPPGDHERYMKPGMRPPPDDYEPDEAELERMRRGDAQPQLILPGDVNLRFATSATRMTPADPSRERG